jgi:hypothetical protein
MLANDCGLAVTTRNISSLSANQFAGDMQRVRNASKNGSLVSHLNEGLYVLEYMRRMKLTRSAAIKDLNYSRTLGYMILGLAETFQRLSCYKLAYVLDVEWRELRGSKRPFDTAIQNFQKVVSQSRNPVFFLACVKVLERESVSWRDIGDLDRKRERA